MRPQVSDLATEVSEITERALVVGFYSGLGELGGLIVFGLLGGGTRGAMPARLNEISPEGSTPAGGVWDGMGYAECLSMPRQIAT